MVTYDYPYCSGRKYGLAPRPTITSVPEFASALETTIRVMAYATTATWIRKALVNICG